MGQNPWPAKEKISITNPTFKIYGCNNAPYLHPKIMFSLVQRTTFAMLILYITISMQSQP